MVENVKALILITDPVRGHYYCAEKQNAIVTEVANRTIVNVVLNEPMKHDDWFLSDLIDQAQVLNLSISLDNILKSTPINSQAILLGESRQVWPLRHRLTLSGVSPNRIQLYSFDSVTTLFCGYCHNLWNIDKDINRMDSSVQRNAHKPDYCKQCASSVMIQDHFSPFYGAYLALPCH